MWTSLLRLSPAFCLAVTLAPAVFVAGADLMPTVIDAQAKVPASNRDEKESPGSSSSDDAVVRARAEKLHRHSIVIDTHNDITSPLVDEGFDLGMQGDDPAAKVKTHTDLKRMKAGGLGAEFFAVYVGKEFVNKKPSEGGGAARRALDVIDVVREQARRHPESLEMASTTADIRRIAKSGKIAALMGIEGGHAIEDSLRALRMFYTLGVRYMTLTHTNTNDWADSEADINDPNVKHHNGLTDFGREVVREMNRIGMMVDISHVADKTFYDVIETSRAPVIASHSSARAIANHPRNMSDDMLRALAKNGGVVMVNFYDGFLDPRKAELTLRSRKIEAEIAARYPNDPKRVNEEMDKWRAANDPGKTPLSVLIDHIDHIAKVAGIDHVGIGSDFDGVPLTGLPEGMEDMSKLPNITYELMKRGYSDADIKKVLGENFLRVMSQVERVASEMTSNRPRVQTSKRANVQSSAFALTGQRRKIMAKRVFTKEKTLKAEDYHGMCHFENVPAEIMKHSIKSVNLKIPFEESTKLLVALQSAVMSMNKYDRTKEKKTGLLLSIKFESRTATIVETDNISDT